MRTDIAERAERLAEYITEHRATVRAAAKPFCVSTSTVHKAVTERLQSLNPALAARVRELLEQNKAERHLRGGQATKEKFARRRSGAEK